MLFTLAFLSELDFCHMYVSREYCREYQRVFKLLVATQNSLKPLGRVISFYSFFLLVQNTFNRKKIFEP